MFKPSYNLINYFSDKSINQLERGINTLKEVSGSTTHKTVTTKYMLNNLQTNGDVAKVIMMILLMNQGI